MADRFDDTYVPAISIAQFYRDAGEVEKATGRTSIRYWLRPWTGVHTCSRASGP